MIPVILSLAARLWGCSPEFEKVGDPEANLFTGSGGGPAENEQDVGVVDSYTDVQRDSGKPPSVTDIGNPDHDEEEPEVFTPPPPPPPDQTPTFRGIISPEDGAFAVLPNRINNKYEFKFECNDPERSLSGSALIISDGNRTIIDTDHSNRDSSTTVGSMVTVALPGGDIPILIPLSWRPTRCEDSAGNKASMGRDWASFEAIDRSVVHYWSFDAIVHQNGKDYFEDRSNNNKPGRKLGNTSLVQRGHGMALECDGVDGYVQTEQLVPVGIANTWTISWWQYLNRSDRNQVIVQIALSSNNPNENPRNWIEATTVQNSVAGDFRRLTISYSADDGDFWQFVTGNDVLRTGVWQHIAVVHDETLAPDVCNVRLYMNGVIIALQANGNDPPCKPQVSFDRFINLCRELQQDQRYLQGAIDEFVIRNRAMSHREIQAEYNRNVPQ